MVYTNLLCIRGFARFGGVLLRGIVLSRSLPLAVDDFSEGLAPLLSGALQKSAVRFYLCQGSSLACLLCGGFLPPPLYQPLGHSLTPSFVLSFFHDLLPFLHTLVINDLITLAGVLFFFLNVFVFSSDWGWLLHTLVYPSKARAACIARLAKLDRVNGSGVSSRERTDAEKLYLRGLVMELDKVCWRRHLITRREGGGEG